MDKLILSDGREISSGKLGEISISSISHTRQTNDSTDISLGSACAAMLKVGLLSEKPVEIPVGTSMIYMENDIQKGVFYCQKPHRKGQYTWELTAYDAMTKFDKDVSNWINTRRGDTVLSLLLELCKYCDVETDIEALPGGDLTIPEVTASGLSGRQLLRFLGQATGRYFTINAIGKLVDGWYAPSCSIENYFYLTYEDYQTAPIRRVLIRQTDTDVGSVWPDGSLTEENTLILQGNPLLSGDNQPVAQRLYEQIQSFTHTPFQCKLLPHQVIDPGCLVTFTDAEGRIHTGAVMESTVVNGICTITGTGNPTLQSTSAYNELTMGVLNEKILQVSRTAEGLKISHADTQGKMADLSVSLSGVSSSVKELREDTEGLKATLEQTNANQTSIKQTADAVKIEVDRILQNGTTKVSTSKGFTFDDRGLTISDPSNRLTNVLDENGMKVKYNGSDMLVADSEGVEAKNLKASTYLIVGGRSRFENIRGSNRTGCFWIGG